MNRLALGVLSKWAMTIMHVNVKCYVVHVFYKLFYVKIILNMYYVKIHVTLNYPFLLEGGVVGGKGK